MKVEQGQLLARLDDTNVQTSLRLAEAQLVSARQSLTETRVRIREAQQELERQKGLLKSKIATQADYDHAEVGAGLCRQIRPAESRCGRGGEGSRPWQQQLDDTIIRAPFAGSSRPRMRNRGK